LRVRSAECFIVTAATGDGQKSNHDRRESKTRAQASHHITSQRYEHWLSEAHSTAKKIAVRGFVDANDPICDVANDGQHRTQIGRKKDSRLWISRTARSTSLSRRTRSAAWAAGVARSRPPPARPFLTEERQFNGRRV
jgi:hypothetical protein